MGIQRIKRLWFKLGSLGRYSYALLHRCVVPKYNTARSNGSMLLICYGGVGDILLSLEFARTLFEECKYRSDTSLTVLCTRRTRAFLRDIGDLKDVDFIEDETLEQTQNFSLYYRCLKHFRGKQFDRIIDVVPNSITASLVMNICAKEKMKTDHAYKDTNWIKDIVKNLAYTKVIDVPPETMMFSRQKTLMQALGFREYQSLISLIPPLETSIEIPDKPYIAVCMGSSRTDRRWDPSNFVRLINEITAKWHLHVVLTGGANENAIYKEMQNKLTHPVYILNYIGRTNTPEWIELIRASKLVVGVDSGCVHLAASVQTAAICIVGGWDYKEFHPYAPDIMRERDTIPICVYNKKTVYCYGCSSLHGKRGYANLECKKAIKQGQPLLCLQEISYEQVREKVYEQIERFLRTEG